MCVTTIFGASPIVRNMRKVIPAPQSHRRVWYAKEWIAHKGLRQSDIVARTPFNKGQVSEYVNGKRRWNQDVLEAFANAIGVEWDDLLRPPINVKNELAEYIMRLDEKQRAQALKIIKALSEKDVA
jgi:transcriptional regulator with XRE-family HTH domain